MFNFLSPRKITDMNKTVYAFFKFYKNAEVSEVTNFCRVLATYRIFCFNSFPWIFLKLLDTKAHIALLAVESKDNGFNLITYMQEILCRTKVLAPRHFRNMDKSFYTWLNFNECAVVSDNDNLTVDMVTNLKICVKSIPWMWSKLFQAKSNTLFLIIKIKNNDIDLLIKFNHLMRITYTPQRKICNMN